MQGNFSYHNPTKLYFGDESLNYLKDELKNFGSVVLLEYGSGSVKRNGIYDQVVATPDMIPGITKGTICYPAGYMDLKPEDITEILQESL